MLRSPDSNDCSLNRYSQTFFPKEFTMYEICKSQIMKTMWAASYHHNSLVTSNVTGNTMYSYNLDVYNCISCAQIHELPQSYCSNKKEIELPS